MNHYAITMPGEEEESSEEEDVREVDTAEALRAVENSEDVEATEGR